MEATVTCELSGIADLLGRDGDASEHYFAPGWLPLERINRLEQIRKTINEAELSQLVSSIRQVGLMSPPIVALFTEPEAQRYLAILNLLWQTEYVLADLSSVEYRGAIYFAVLVAGHRRYAACGRIAQGKGKLPRCLRRKDGTLLLSVQLGHGMSAKSALQCQFMENTYVPPPLPEQADAIRSLYELLNPEELPAGNSKPQRYTLKEFAESIGYTPERVRSAIRFCIADQQVRESVELGLFEYGHAVELGRLNQAGEQQWVEFYLKLVVAERLTVGQLRKKVSTFLSKRKAEGDGQLDLGDLFASTQVDLTRRVTTAIQVGNYRSLLDSLNYLRRVQALRDGGYLSKADSPYWDQTTVGAVQKIIAALRSLMPELELVLESTEVLNVERLLERGETVTQDLLQALAVTPESVTRNGKEAMVVALNGHSTGGI